MGSKAAFPANSVLDWYEEAEGMLSKFLEYVPYCDEHERVWSPKLAIILQETCSQLDSLWKWEAAKIHGKSNADIRDYFKIYGADMAQRWVVFWADSAMKLEPFIAWRKAKAFLKGEARKYPLDWWKEGYQKIKHNRLENRACADLKRVTNALAALFLAILRCERCWDYLWERHLMFWDDSGGMPYDPLDCLREDFGLMGNMNKCNLTYMVVESRLFSYPVGIAAGLHRTIKNRPNWGGNCSRRFKAWYYDLCKRDGV